MQELFWLCSWQAKRCWIGVLTIDLCVCAQCILQPNCGTIYKCPSVNSIARHYVDHSQALPLPTLLNSSANPSARRKTLMATRYREPWHETGLNELFSVLLLFLWGSLVGNWLAAGPHPWGPMIFWVIVKLLQQEQLCWDVSSCRVCECLCLCLRELGCVHRVLGVGYAVR